MSRDQLKRLKLLESENTRLRRAVSDLTLDKMILTEAAGGNYYALHVAAGALSTCVRFWASQNAGRKVSMMAKPTLNRRRLLIIASSSIVAAPLSGSANDANTNIHVVKNRNVVAAMHGSKF